MEVRDRHMQHRRMTAYKNQTLFNIHFDTVQNQFLPHFLISKKLLFKLVCERERERERETQILSHLKHENLLLLILCASGSSISKFKIQKENQVTLIQIFIFCIFKQALFHSYFFASIILYLFYYIAYNVLEPILTTKMFLSILSS